MKDGQSKETLDIKPLVDEVIDEYKSTGITTITERKVVIGPDGKRRVLSRRRIVNTPPQEKANE